MSDLNLRPPPAYPGMKIGLFGGTFDPPHDGHLHVAETALKRLGLDQVWWLVTPGNPLKDRAGMSKFKKRLKESRTFARHPKIIVTGLEAGLGSAYSANTISFILNRYPETHFVWVMGADNLENFHHWQQWREIMRSLPVAIADRPGFRHKALSAVAAICFARYRVDEADAAGLWRYRAPAWTLLTLQLSSLSSTELRTGKKLKKS